LAPHITPATAASAAPSAKVATITLVGIDAHQAGHARVFRHGAHRAAHLGFFDQQHQAGHEISASTSSSTWVCEITAPPIA
jgi:hypothetical protein